MRTAVITASYDKDFSRCRLLCETMDERLKGDWMHYILVASHDVALFRTLQGPRRQVVDERDLLPVWLRPIPDLMSCGRRKMWISPYSLPLRGWHIQQLRRFGIARQLSEAAMFAIDSDVVLLKDFDVARLWHGDRLRFYRRDREIGNNPLSNHLAWLAHSDRLLGIGPYRLPAHDYINTLIAWRTDTTRALLDHVEELHARHWVRAIIRTSAFSECLIYGRYADEVEMGRGHYASPDPLCQTLWFEDHEIQGADGLRRFIDRMQPYQIGIGLQSFIGHDVADIRKVVLSAAA
ncbi:DUF6492 family protein [Ensifer soli]|uniref:DUF6492 family protein n=1 Tax=Ciceribacter sp. sgz301302 TaxID=3342379 RepID=UPI0035B88333